MRRILVNEQTGEFLNIKSERFTKTMVEVWRYMNKKNVFTTAEEKTLHRLSMYLQLNTNAIISPNGEYMNIERMAQETGIDRSNIRKVIRELMKKNAIGMWRSGDKETYYMNPFLYQMGDVPKYLFGLFDEESSRRKRKDNNLLSFKAGKKETSILTQKTASKAV